MRCPSLKELPAPPAGKSGWPWTVETPILPYRMPDGGDWPRISIVTPSYNQGHFIEETIRAILLQGYPDFEYVISEDSSTDNTLEVESKYERWLTVLMADKKGGMSKAINRAWKRTTGEIVTWISSDDIYLERSTGSPWPIGRIQGLAKLLGHFASWGPIRSSPLR
jgi:cellulose synthase/poly-beta-1,6-N-acetylglucosamine synthase-like glycosyltransferase